MDADKKNKPTVDEFGNPIPVHRIQVRLARIVIVVLVVMFIALQFFGTPKINVVTKGDSTVYTSDSSFNLFFIILSVITGIIAFLYVRQPGIYRFFGAVLIAITAWLAYTAFNMDISNHNVTVTPTSVSCEVGTKSKPIRHSIDFTTTAYLYIDEVPGNRGPKYELAANAATDGAETRVPIFDMMRAALPQILETASRNNVVIGDSPDGSIIPAALKVDTGK
jgi:hypothetical protein